MKFGELIAIGRECKGWTLRDMERETGISNALISQIERGHVKDCGFRTAITLIDALGISLERAAKTVRPFKPSDILRTTVIGKVSGEPREGDHVPGMPHAICHACGLRKPCDDPDCPNVCEHDWQTWPETNGNSQRCSKCQIFRYTPMTNGS